MSKSETPGIDALREHVRVLTGLLDDPHPGLFTWRTALYRQIQEIKQFGLSSLDHAALDLLAGLKLCIEVMEGECCASWEHFPRLKSLIAEAEGKDL